MAPIIASTSTRLGLTSSSMCISGATMWEHDFMAVGVVVMCIHACCCWRFVFVGGVGSDGCLSSSLSFVHPRLWKKEVLLWPSVVGGAW